jgi:hypothetical protein
MITKFLVSIFVSGSAVAGPGALLDSKVDWKLSCKNVDRSWTVQMGYKAETDQLFLHGRTERAEGTVSYVPEFVLGGPVVKLTENILGTEILTVEDKLSPVGLIRTNFKLYQATWTNSSVVKEGDFVGFLQIVENSGSKSVVLAYGWYSCVPQ